ncbi:hypothetical protein AVEN_252965-1 [Araneus ventricosus]|uniref:Uncharacterized protein n=1 Tax=Araneus ventricosus TaxID=182803 RepID=A0A4Y2W238_ARAVE|nr:hypothetical protein AVEN_252965-1 [Araneus ventricosus]
MDIYKTFQIELFDDYNPSCMRGLSKILTAPATPKKLSASAMGSPEAPVKIPLTEPFLLSRIRNIQRGSIVIVKKFELGILTNLHVLDLPESEKHNFGIMSVCVCEHDNYQRYKDEIWYVVFTHNL